MCARECDGDIIKKITRKKLLKIKKSLFSPSPAVSSCRKKNFYLAFIWRVRPVVKIKNFFIASVQKLQKKSTPQSALKNNLFNPTLEYLRWLVEIL